VSVPTSQDSAGYLAGATVTAKTFNDLTTLSTTTANSSGQFGISGLNALADHLLEATQSVAGKTFNLKLFVRTDNSLSHQDLDFSTTSTVATEALQKLANDWAGITTPTTPQALKPIYDALYAQAESSTPDLTDAASVTASAASLLSATIPSGSYLGAYHTTGRTGKLGANISGGNITLVFFDDSARTGTGIGAPTTFGSPFSIDILGGGNLLDTTLASGAASLNGIFADGAGVGLWTDGAQTGLWSLDRHRWNYSGLYFGVANGDDNAVGGFCAALVQEDGTANFLMWESVTDYRVFGSGTVDGSGNLGFTYNDNLLATDSATATISGSTLSGAFIGANGDTYSFNLTR